MFSAVSEHECTGKEAYERKCEICHEQEFKYRCPGCNMKTCSLKCVKEHKEKRNCLGKRCMTKFVSIKDFTDNDLQSDYRFLENVSHCCSNATRYERSQPKFSRWSNKNRNRLVSMAWKKGIKLHLLSLGMSKQKENTTVFNNREKCIYWRIQLVFVHENEEFIISRVKETENLRDILKKYIDPKDSDETMKYRLPSYFDATIDNVCVYLKMEQISHLEYYQMDLSESLNNCLQNKAIYEYPVFYVLISGKDSTFKSNQEDAREHKKITTINIEGIKSEQHELEKQSNPYNIANIEDKG